MCQEDHHEATTTTSRQQYPDPFPWHIGAYDAHCHPTDTMAAAVANIPAMHARALTIMATRAQDQSLVAEVACDLGIQGPGFLSPGGDSSSSSTQGTGVIPAFGWHPWFSHQIYDDTKSDGSTFDLDRHDGSEEDAKKAHYEAVLQPSPAEDPDFLASLPKPIPLSSFLDSTRSLLKKYPLALVGEIGLDKAFRLPRQWESSPSSSTTAETRDQALTPGGREGRPLSPYRVRMQHQQTILESQLRLAGEQGRAVSVHGVQAHGVVFESITKCWKGHEREYVSKRKRKMDAASTHERDTDDDDDDDDDNNDDNKSGGTKQHQDTPKGNAPYPPRICLHSFSGSVEVLKQWLSPTHPADVFFSFSVAVNFGNESGRARTAEVIRTVPDGRILVESDLHVAGEPMDTALEDMYRKVCEIKGWGLEDGVARIRENFQRFIFG